MDQMQELLEASFKRLEGLIGEVKELRFKIKDVQGDIDGLRSAIKESRQDDQQGAGRQGGQGPQRYQLQQRQQGQGGDDLEKRLTRIEDRLDYLSQRWMEVDETLYKLHRKEYH
ncbi:MAG: hypothetical protein ACOY93_03935 [Bacillota bacterium]